MKILKRIFIITLAIILGIVFISCSNTNNQNNTSDTAKIESENIISDTIGTEAPTIQTIDLLSPVIEKYISFSGADGFGEMELNIEGIYGEVSNAGVVTHSLTDSVQYPFIISNGEKNILQELCHQKLLHLQVEIL